MRKAKNDVMLNLFQHLSNRSRNKFGMTVFVLFFIFSSLFPQPVPGSYYDFVDATKDMPAGHDKTSLIIYRCFLRLQDEEGNDVTYTACTATYEWMSTPDIIRNYKKTYFLSGGMAMHLKLKKGRYKISLYTPKDQQNNFTYAEAGAKTFQWESNIFEYDTENPAKVIFVTPTRNDNGFYNGGWIIDYKDGRKP